MPQNREPSASEEPLRSTKHRSKPQRDVQRAERREWADNRRSVHREDSHSQRGPQHARLRQVQKGDAEDWEDYDC